MPLDSIDAGLLNMIAMHIFDQVAVTDEPHAMLLGVGHLAHVSRSFCQLQRAFNEQARLQLAIRHQGHPSEHVLALGPPNYGLILNAHDQLQRDLLKFKEGRVQREIWSTSTDPITRLGKPDAHHSVLIELEEEADGVARCLKYDGVDVVSRAWTRSVLVKYFAFLDRTEWRQQAEADACQIYGTPERDMYTALTRLLTQAALKLGGMYARVELWWLAHANRDHWHINTPTGLPHVDGESATPSDLYNWLSHNRSLLLAMCRAHVVEAHRALHTACKRAERLLLHDRRWRTFEEMMSDASSGAYGKRFDPHHLVMWADLCEADGRPDDAEKILIFTHAISCPLDSSRLCAPRLRRLWAADIIVARRDPHARLPSRKLADEGCCTLSACWGLPAQPCAQSHPANWQPPPTHRGRGVRGRGGDAIIDRMGQVALHYALPTDPYDSDSRAGDPESRFTQLDLDYDLFASGVVGMVGYTLLGAAGRMAGDQAQPRRFMLARDFHLEGFDETDGVVCATACAIDDDPGDGVRELPLGWSFLRSHWRNGMRTYGPSELEWNGHAVSVKVSLGGVEVWVDGTIVDGDIVSDNPFHGGRAWPSMEIECEHDNFTFHVTTDLGGHPWAWKLRCLRCCIDDECPCARYLKTRKRGSSEPKGRGRGGYGCSGEGTAGCSGNY